MLLVCALAGTQQVKAESVPVHHREGISHGFLVLRSVDGTILASGDQIQTVRGDRVTCETVFHFKDGSLHDETAEFTQDGVFRLISDHLIQSGPSFPHPIDIRIEAAKKQVLIKSADSKGDAKTAEKAKAMELPEDVANGMIITLLRNIPPESAETKVSMLATSAKPRLVKLVISGMGGRSFSVAGSSRKATDYLIKVEIGGLAGVIAPLLGKKPADTHIWISTGPSPTFVRSEGPLYEGGPIWRIELASLQVSDHDLHSPQADKQSKQK